MEEIKQYDAVGRISEALVLAQHALSHANAFPDSIEVRQAHNTLGMLHYRTCHFNSSTHHLLIALNLAKANKESLYEFAALSNIACLLRAVGFIREAVELSRELCNFPQDSYKYQQLHFQTCVNALKFGYDGKFNQQELQIFIDTLGNLQGSNYFMSVLERAYMLAGRVTYMLCGGADHDKLRLYENEIDAFNTDTNPRVAAVLLITKSHISLRFDDVQKIEQNARALLELLPQIREFAEAYEDALGVLLDLYERINLDCSRRINSVHIARLLREHLITVKKQVFIKSVCCKSSTHSASSIGSASGSLDWINDLQQAVKEYSKPPALLRATEPDELHADCRLSSLARMVSEQSQAAFDRGFRNNAYDVAENWAVAAELRAQGNGRALFGVGMLAYATAIQAGYKKREAVRIGMACRIKDVAQLFINDEHISKFGQLREDNFRGREHAVYAADMFRGSSDLELRRFAKMTRHHHEWWNGCGYPDGLRGESIPVGSRICAYADIFVALIWERVGDIDRWSIDDAVRQIRSMGGIQLDPHLFAAFSVAVGQCSNSLAAVADTGFLSLEKSTEL